jgi:hypothetical protein
MLEKRRLERELAKAQRPYDRHYKQAKGECTRTLRVHISMTDSDKIAGSAPDSAV